MDDDTLSMVAGRTEEETSARKMRSKICRIVKKFNEESLQLKILTDFCMMPSAVSLAAVTRVRVVRIFQMETNVASILWRVVNPQVGQSHLMWFK